MKAGFFATVAGMLMVALPSGTSASTVIAAGSYESGDSVFVGDSLFLGAGAYRFTLILSAPSDSVSGEVTKVTNYVDYCEIDGNGTLVYCGSDDVPTSPLLDPVNATTYTALLSVDAPYSISYGDGSRTDYFDTCCNYQFGFLADTGGAYTFSYTTVPEPATWGFFVLGFGVIGASIRRKRWGPIPRLA